MNKKKNSSKELYLACIIYKENQEGRPIGNTRLNEILKDEIEEEKIKEVINTLFDWGIIKSEYGELTETTAGRCYFISNDSKETIRRLSEDYLDFYEPDQKISFKYIDTTPDGNYALRILEAYLEDTKYLTTDNMSGNDPECELCKELNYLQAKCADELKEAIKKITS